MTPQIPNRTVTVRRRRVFGLGWAVVAALYVAGSVSNFVAANDAREEKEQTKLLGRIIVVDLQGPLRGSFLAVDPNDHTWTKLPAPGSPLTLPRISPGESMVAYETRVLPNGDSVVFCADLEGEQSPVRIFERNGGRIQTVMQLTWLSAGKELIVSFPSTRELVKFETWKVSADGSMREKLSTPDTELVVDAMPDGKWFVTRSARAPWDGPGLASSMARPSFLMRPDGSDARLLAEAAANSDASPIRIWNSGERISPDGRTVAILSSRTEVKGGVYRFAGSDLSFVDADGKRKNMVRKGSASRSYNAGCWSPDGRFLAVAKFETPWEEPVDLLSPAFRNGDGVNGSVEICDRDSKLVTTLRLPPSPRYGVIDWR